MVQAPLWDLCIEVEVSGRAGEIFPYSTNRFFRKGLANICFGTLFFGEKVRDVDCLVNYILLP